MTVGNHRTLSVALFVDVVIKFLPTFYHYEPGVPIMDQVSRRTRKRRGRT